MIKTRFNQFGFQVVRFYVNGIPSDIILDDSFPIAGGIKDPKRALEPQGNNYWPLFVEKAWAKLKRSYYSDTPILAQYALEEMTGKLTGIV